ncbi:MAG: hypothetical protein J7M25_16820 [Deltaproteobacteria bacterium]|nr:hypothetical protein [Deltaproteobacteria bacterium]
MAKEDIRKDALRVHSPEASHDAGVSVEDDVVVIVTKLFCPNGHNLVNQESHKFDGYGGIRLLVSDGKVEDVVELSPFHGDLTKYGPTFETGTKLSIRCPDCGVELPVLAKCGCEWHGDLRKLYLTESIDDAYLVTVCDVWGCPRSRVIDGNEILSEFLEGNIFEEDQS